MDYIWKAIGIVFLVAIVLFIYNALKIQHGSNHFPTPKDDSKKKEEDEYQRYAEEELEKNTKQMESFKGEDGEVIPENKKLTKDERLALIKESAEKKSADDKKAISDVNYERAKKDKLERDLKAWKRLGAYNK